MNDINTMIEKFEMTGEWFLPSQPDNRVHGTVIFDPIHGINLNIYGVLEGDPVFPEFKDQEIILGLTSNSKQVTLYKCWLKKANGSTLVAGQGSGKPVKIYSVGFVFVGMHAETSPELTFTKMRCEIFNLGEWVGVSGFNKPESLAKKEVTIKFKLPESIEFDIDNTTKGSFYFSATQNISSFQESVSLRQKVEYQVESTTKSNIDIFLEYLMIFQNFLSLALYKSTYPIAVKLYKDGTNSKIDFYFSARGINMEEKPASHMEMVFSYQSIKSDFPNFIKKWHTDYSLLEPAFNLVFEQFYRPYQFNSNVFLNLAQAAETFHAMLYNHTKIDKSSYTEMKKDILATTSPEYHSWLKEQFNFGNNLNLHQRLEELINKSSNSILDEILGDKKKFLMDVKNSRNYYTHYSHALKKKALKGAELYYLSERLKLLMVCTFLINTGFTKSLLEKCLESIKWPLFNHLIN